MLATTSRKLTGRCSLRSQLKSVLLRLGDTTELRSSQYHSRPFHSHTRCWQTKNVIDVDHDARDAQHDRADYGHTRHLYPQGRVVGRAGRQQRETFEPLAIDSLGRRSEVVVFRDIGSASQPPDLSHDDSATLDLADNAAQEQASLELDGDYQVTERELFASIEATRPLLASLEREEFDELVKKISRSYSKSQLKRYFEANSAPTVSSPAANDSVDTPTVSGWSKGTSELSQRLSTDSRHADRLTLPQLAEHIIRDIWGTSLHQELQEIGELELGLTSTQYDFMAGRYAHEQGWQSMLPRTLAHVVEISLIEPEKIVRLTGRRYDALEASHVISELLAGLTSIQLPLKNSELVRPPNSKILSEIQEATGTYIELRPDQIQIIGSSQKLCYHAKRMLVMSIVPPSKPSVINSRPTFTTGALKTQVVPVPSMGGDQQSTSGSDIHLRETVVPKTDRSAFACLSRRTRLLDDAIAHTAKAAKKMTAQNTSDTSKSGLRMGPWIAAIGYCLQTAEQSRQADSRMWMDCLPALGSVMPHLKPQSLTEAAHTRTPNATDRSRGTTSSTRRLTARLVPSPFLSSSKADQAARELPVLLLDFRVQTQMHHNGVTWQLIYTDVTLPTQEQRVIVPLPDRAADMQLERTVGAAFDVGAGLESSSNQSLGQFVRSMEALQLEPTSDVLETLLPQYDIHVPLRALDEKSAETFDVPYICTTLSLYQSVDLVPSFNQAYFTDLQYIQEGWRDDLRLRLQFGTHSDTRSSTMKILVTGRDSVAPSIQEPDGQAHESSAALEVDHTPPASPRVIANRQNNYSDLRAVFTGAVAMIDLSTAASQELPTVAR